MHHVSTHYEISRPLPSDVATLYEGIEKEKHRLVHVPESLSDITTRWGDSMLLFSGKVDGSLAALFALCSPVFLENGIIDTGWIMLYFLPEYRGRDAFALGDIAVKKITDWGATQLYTACRKDNRAAQCFAQHFGFVRTAGSSDVIYYKLELQNA